MRVVWKKKITLLILGQTCSKKASTLSSFANDGEPPASFMSDATTTFGSCAGDQIEFKDKIFPSYVGKCRNQYF